MKREDTLYPYQQPCSAQMLHFQRSHNVPYPNCACLCLCTTVHLPALPLAYRWPVPKTASSIQKSVRVLSHDHSTQKPFKRQETRVQLAISLE